MPLIPLPHSPDPEPKRFRWQPALRVLAMLLPIQVGMGGVLYTFTAADSQWLYVGVQALTLCLVAVPVLWWLRTRGAGDETTLRQADLSRAHARLRRGYGAILTIIAVIIVCRTWVVQQEIAQAKGREALIEAANAQRDAGEMLALAVTQLAAGSQAAMRDIGRIEALALQMQTALETVERHAGSLRDAQVSLVAILADARIQVQALCAAAHRIGDAAAAADEQANPPAAVAQRWLALVRLHQSAHARAMDRAIATLALTADARVLGIARISVIASALLLAFLSFAVCLVLEPAARVLEQQTRHIQEQQRQSDRLAEIARGTSEAVVISDAEGRIEWVNAAFTRMTGYALAEVSGRRAEDFLHGPHTDPATMDRIGCALSRGEPVQVEAVNYAKDGREFISRLDLKPLHAPSGELSGFMSIRADVTTERRMEAALRASEQRFRALVEGTDVIVWEFDPSLNAFTYVSPHATRMGYTLDQWLQPGFFETHLHPDDRDAALEYCKQETMAGRNHRLQYRMLRADGAVVWIDDWVSVETLPDGSRLMRGVFTDITELKRAQEKLRDMEERWNMALQGSGDGVWDWDIPARVIYRSPSWKETLGYSADELGTQAGYWEMLIHPEDRARARAALDGHLDGRLPAYRSEHRMRCKDGSYKWVLARGKVLRRSPDGRPLRVVGTQTDISAQRALQDELHRHHNHLQMLVEERTADLTRTMQDAEAARVMAERANKSKSMFLANMSHELRTPMHAILSFAHLGATRHAELDPSRLGRYFERIEASGGRLLKLLNDLLDLSKLESGRAVVQPEWISGSALVNSVAEELEPLLQNGRHRLRIHADCEPGPIWADGERIRQVLRNLIANAIRFSPDGGAIDVRIERRHEAGAHTVELSVSDEGVGIPPEELDSIFDEFVQSSKTVSGAGGTGLGLAICKRIVDAHGGTIEASNRDGGGACFAVRLPQPRGDAQPLAAHAA